MENKFKYNGKESQDDLDLGWIDYGWRNYDPSLGRFNTLDPHADRYFNHTPYNYAFSNPINVIDPDGRDGIATIDKEKKTVNVSQTFHYSKENAEVLKKALSNLSNGSMTIDEFMADFNSNWGGEASSIEIDGEEYSVSYSATFIAHDSDTERDKAVENDVTSNKLVFDTGIGSAGNWRASERTIKLNPPAVRADNTRSYLINRDLN